MHMSMSLCLEHRRGNELKISIITVCYNSVDTIRDTIESVRKQNFRNIEYIIVDGCSDDGTQDIIKEYQDDVDIFISEADRGIYDAINKGIGVASGDLITILNSDDYFAYDDVLTEVVHAVDNNSGIQILFGDVVQVSRKNTDKPVRRYSSKWFVPWMLRFGIMPPHPGTFVRKEVYEKYGLYSLSYKISSDYEMFVRWLIKHQLKFLRLNKVMVRMRVGGVSTKDLKARFQLNSEIVEACRSNGIYTNLFIIAFKIPLKLSEFFVGRESLRSSG